ncbi:MAG: hypothetical protein NE330_05820 [Lentisphaeraceae bacterium]|nr:hypothetical protein [Lentisphaeraceae bacterium]
MLEVYPHDHLPLPEQKSYSLDKAKVVARTEMEGGNVRQRKRYSTAPDDLGYSWVMSRDEFKIFESWHEHKINSGSDWFQMKVSDGLGENLRDCRFKSSYKAKAYGPNHFSINAQVECRDRTIMNETDLDAILS